MLEETILEYIFTMLISFIRYLYLQADNVIVYAFLFPTIVTENYIGNNESI